MKTGRSGQREREGVGAGALSRFQMSIMVGDRMSFSLSVVLPVTHACSLQLWVNTVIILGTSPM